MSQTKILPCKCESEYQDMYYGADMRVHNAAKDSWVCTVCGARKPRQPDPIIKQRKK